MARIKFTRQQLQTIGANALGEPKLINGFFPFLKECIRWGLPPRVLLDIAQSIGLAAAKTLLQNSVSEVGEQVDIEDLPVWIEIDPLHLTTTIPAGFGFPEVVVTPGPPPVTRPRLWNEARMYIVRDGRHFCPASDGVSYFPASKIVALENELGVLGWVRPNQIPEATP